MSSHVISQHSGTMKRRWIVTFHFDMSRNWMRNSEMVILSEVKDLWLTCGPHT